MLALTWQFSETLTKSVKISVKSIVHNYLHAIKSTQLVAASCVVALTSVISYTCEEIKMANFHNDDSNRIYIKKTNQIRY